MNKKKINVNDSSILEDHLTTIFFLIENLNHYLAMEEKKHFNDNKANRPNLLKAYHISRKKLFAILKNKPNDYSELPFILRLCAQNNLLPKNDKQIASLVDSWLTSRERDTPILKNSLIKPISSTLQIDEAYELDEKWTSFKNRFGSNWVTSKFRIKKMKEIDTTLRRQATIFFNEPIDFIDVIQNILMKENKLNKEQTDGFIQRWIRQLSKLKFNSNSKRILNRVVKAYNDIFYGAPRVNHQKFRSSRPSTVQTEVLLHCLIESIAKGNLNKKDAISKAIGIYIFFRFCKALRIRYSWIEKNKIIFFSNKSHKRNDLLDSEALNSIHAGVQCVNALFPVEYNFLQSKSFGSFSCLRGLNEIFRGGLLPYIEYGKTTTITGGPGSGKTTFALQRMVEIAFYGGISIYFSFEEDYSIIHDRIYSFGLQNHAYFNIERASFSGIKKVIKDNNRKKTKKGLLLIFKVDREINRMDIKEIIRNISKISDKYGGWKYKALTIDSINALDFNALNRFNFSTLISKSFKKRLCVRRLIDVIKKEKFSGIILKEKNDQNFKMLPYLSDVFIKLYYLEGKRWIEVAKARNQNFHGGKHPCRISDGVGMIVYPSLDSVLSTLRHKIRSTISEKNIIPFPEKFLKSFKFSGIPEKSFSMFRGGAKNIKNAFILEMVCRDAMSETLKTVKTAKKPNTIMIITFKTPESRYLQMLRGYQNIYNNWQRVPNNIIRHFTPGSDITAEQVIDEIRRTIRSVKREGSHIERIVFDEIESANDLLPELKSSRLFWTTLIELLSMESITSFFLVETDDFNHVSIKNIENHMDYIFNIKRAKSKNNDEASIELEVDKWIDPKSMKKHGPIKKTVTIVDDEPVNT